MYKKVRGKGGAEMEIDFEVGNVITEVKPEVGQAVCVFFLWIRCNCQHCGSSYFFLDGEQAECIRCKYTVQLIDPNLIYGFHWRIMIQNGLN